MINTKCDLCSDIGDRYNEVILFEYQELCLNCITKIVKVTALHDATKNILAVKESIVKSGCQPYFGSEGVGIINRGRELWNAVLADLKSINGG